MRSRERRTVLGSPVSGKVRCKWLLNAVQWRENHHIFLSMPLLYGPYWMWEKLATQENWQRLFCYTCTWYTYLQMPRPPFTSKYRFDFDETKMVLFNKTAHVQGRKKWIHSERFSLIIIISVGWCWRSMQLSTRIKWALKWHHKVSPEQMERSSSKSEENI